LARLHLSSFGAARKIQSLFLAKALPEAVFRYFSNARAFLSSVNRTAVLIFQGRECLVESQAPEL